MEGLLCDLIECHIEIDSPWEGLTSAQIEGPETLQLFINCIEDGPVMDMHAVLDELILKLILFKLHYNKNYQLMTQK